MRFGASTYFLKERSVTGALEVIARLGYASAEIWMEHYRAAGQGPATIARHARALGVGLTVHAASYDCNILSTNPGIRRESLRQVRAALRLAASVRAATVTVHPGGLSAARQDRDATWRTLEETAAMLDEWAGQYDLCVGLENMEKGNREIFCFPADVAGIFAIPHRHLRLTLDLAHTRTLMDPLVYLSQIRNEWIGHVHLSDNDLSATHLPLGHGRLQIVPILEALGHFYEGIVSLEGYDPGKGENLLDGNIAYLRACGLVSGA